MITLHSSDQDKVISSTFLTGVTTYEFAVSHLFSLIGQSEFQRRTLDAEFYGRLERDLAEGCIMPPITLAFVDEAFRASQPLLTIQAYVNSSISKGMVLDGLQRLSALKRASSNNDSIDMSRSLYVNILICSSKDNLLYRMVTLNNGQKAMTVRHQIEILTMHLFDFAGYGITVVTEKETEGTKPRGVFKKADLISAYMGFLGNTTSLENSKIIEVKMNELIAKRIIESNITQSEVEFEDVVKLIAKFCQEESAYLWLRNPNNLLPFTVAMRSVIRLFQDMEPLAFATAIQVFETAFKDYDISKIKLSRERRKLVHHYLENYEKLGGMNADDLLNHFSELD